jgi:hypothetical protein
LGLTANPHLQIHNVSHRFFIMMTINLNIKANVNNLSLSQIYELLQKYSLEKVKDQKIYEFKGYRFQIETEINMSINYVITELP